MPTSPAFNASQKIDDADFQRQLDEARDIPFTEELRLLIGGVLAGEGTNRVEARTVMNVAKENALRKARKKLVAALDRQYQDMVDKHYILGSASMEVQDFVDSAGGLKVQA